MGARRATEVAWTGGQVRSKLHLEPDLNLASRQYIYLRKRIKKRYKTKVKRREVKKEEKSTTSSKEPVALL
jgi:hypothetical protein